MPENTTGRDPLLHVLGAMSDGFDGYIEDMEAAGQRQLVAETKTIPTRGSEGLILLGFILGDVHEDGLFRDVTFPAGWTKKTTDHPMWSRIVDTVGRERVSIFYKTAFYDRDAFCRIVDLGTYLWRLVETDSREELVLDDVWATPNAVIEMVHAKLDALAKDTQQWRDMEAGHPDVDYSEFIDSNTEKAQKYQALLDRVHADES